MSELKAKALHMGPAQCAVDLGDGSERGEYVNQDYILQKLGRPHRAINLMYCYYPNDEGWPGRASVVHADPSVQFAWDFPYDDYFTYKGGLNGTRDDEPFTCMRDVRRHGQDVLLTMTIDPKVSDEHLRAIGQDLRTFGRVQLRINHEATGNWFSFNKRASYEEVAAFFAHASEIIREEAPNVKTIICLDGCKSVDDEKMEMEDIFAEASRAADIVSVDFILFETIPQVLLGMFNASADMLTIGVTALRIIGIHYLIAWFCIIAGTVFQALGKAVFSMIVSIMRQLVVLIPVAYVLARVGGLHMVWWSFPIAEVISFIVSTIFLIRIYRTIIQKIPA